MAPRARLVLCLWVCQLCVCLAACDFPAERSPSRGTVLTSSPADGDTDVERRFRARLWVDRFLAPATVNRATVILRSGMVSSLLGITFDPVERAIEVEPFGFELLEPDVRYELVVDGVEDLAGEPLEPERVFFRTGATAGDPIVVPSVSYADVRPIFERHCATSDCHDEGAPSGLDLSSAGGIASSAIGAPARAGGGHDGFPEVGLRGLPIIDVVADGGRPATSYLVYKVLRADEVGGNPMPPDAALSFAEVRLLADWIRDGARLE